MKDEVVMWNTEEDREREREGLGYGNKGGVFMEVHKRRDGGGRVIFIFLGCYTTIFQLGVCLLYIVRRERER